MFEEIKLLSFLCQNIVWQICEEATRLGLEKTDPRVVQAVVAYFNVGPAPHGIFNTLVWRLAHSIWGESHGFWFMSPHMRHRTERLWYRNMCAAESACHWQFLSSGCVYSFPSRSTGARKLAQTLFQVIWRGCTFVEGPSILSDRNYEQPKQITFRQCGWNAWNEQHFLCENKFQTCFFPRSFQIYLDKDNALVGNLFNLNFYVCEDNKFKMLGLQHFRLYFI